MSELTKALCAFHQQVGTIHKDAKAQYGAYADLAGVLSTVLPALSKNGLCISQTFDTERNLITTLTHVSGESQVSTLPMIVQPGRNELHSFGASVTYLRRYAICSILCLVADIDTDGAVEPASVPSAGHSKPAPAPKAAAKPKPEEPKAQPIAKADLDQIIALIKEYDRDYVTKFCKAFAVKFKTGGQKVSDCITTTEHQQWINTWFSENPQ